MTPFRAGHYVQRCTEVLSSTDYWYLAQYFDTLRRCPRFLGKVDG